MTAWNSAAVALVVLVGSLAGCISKDAAPADVPSPSSTVSVASPDANSTAGEVGNIKGTVTDVEAAPILGVSVAIHGTDAVVVTDEAGGFAFTDVPVGAYDILSNKLGYQNGAQRVDVLAGETLFVNFTLNAVEIAPDPYRTVQQFDGLISCGFVFVPVCGVLDELNQGYGTPNPTEEHWLFGWAYGHSTVPTTVVFELVWQPTAPETAKQLTILALDGFSGDATGPSVLKLVVSGKDFDEIEEDPNFRFSIGIYPDVEPVVNQRFTLYRTDFFHEEAPEGYSVLNEP